MLTESFQTSRDRDSRLSRSELERRLRQMDKQLQGALEQLEVAQQLAYRDPLTGLKNRRAFDEAMTQELARIQRRPGSGFGILAIDVNDFKTINDTLGHATGDAVLVAVARHLEKTLRGYDVVCRTGGDEFLVILPEAGAVNCSAAASRVVRGLSDLGVPGVPRVSLAIGWAVAPEGGCSISELTQKADLAMYEDKARAKALAKKVA